MSQTKPKTLLTDDSYHKLLASSEEIIKRAKQYHEADKALKEQLAAAAPAVADELVKYACISPEDRDNAIRTLQDPVQTLNLVRKLASFHLTQTGNELGQPVSTEPKLTENRVDSYGRPKSAALEKARNELLDKSKSWNLAGSR